MKPIQVLKNWRQRLDLIASWGLASTDVVLEIGTGHNPTPRADILCERFLSDGTERHDALPLVDRPFVVGDVHDLPFVDQAVDFAVCTHVLEHVPDPARAVGELTRVAARGYLETPSAVWERMHSFPFHRWYVSEEDGVMVFRAKNRAIHDAGTLDWMKRLTASHDGLMDHIIRHERELGTIVGIVWQGEQPVRVEGTPAPETAEGFTGAASPSRAQDIEVLRRAMGARPRSMADRVYRTVSRRLRKRSTPGIDLESVLRCPTCHQPLLWDEVDPGGSDGSEVARDRTGGQGPASAATRIRCARGHSHDAVTVRGQTVPFLLPPKEDARTPD